MYRVLHSHENIFIQEKVETLYHLNTRIISLELFRIPAPESAQSRNLPTATMFVLQHRLWETINHPSSSFIQTPTTHQCFDPRSDDCVVFCRRFAIPGNIKPKTLLSRTSAHLSVAVTSRWSRSVSRIRKRSKNNHQEGKVWRLY